MIFVVFASRSEFDQFKAEFPRTLADPDTLLGEPAPVSTDAEGNPTVDSLWIISHHFNADECAILQMAGADVRVGGMDGPDWGSDEGSL